MFELPLKIENNEVESKFHHSTRLTSSVNERVYQKIGNAKETYSFKFDCFVGHVSKTGKACAYSTRRLFVSFRLHLEGVQQFHLFCCTSKTPLSPRIRQSSLYQRGLALHYTTTTATHANKLITLHYTTLIKLHYTIHNTTLITSNFTTLH